MKGTRSSRLCREEEPELEERGVTSRAATSSTARASSGRPRGATGVFHCAGKVSRDPEDAEELYQLHVEGTRTVLAASKAKGVRRFVLASTSGTVAVSADPDALRDRGRRGARRAPVAVALLPIQALRRAGRARGERARRLRGRLREPDAPPRPRRPARLVHRRRAPLPRASHPRGPGRRAVVCRRARRRGGHAARDGPGPGGPPLPRRGEATSRSATSSRASSESRACARPSCPCRACR